MHFAIRTCSLLSFCKIAARSANHSFKALQLLGVFCLLPRLKTLVAASTFDDDDDDESCLFRFAEHESEKLLVVSAAANSSFSGGKS